MRYKQVSAMIAFFLLFSISLSGFVLTNAWKQTICKPSDLDRASKRSGQWSIPSHCMTLDLSDFIVHDVEVLGRVDENNKPYTSAVILQLLIQALENSWGGGCTITELDMSGCGLTDTDVPALINIITENTISAQRLAYESKRNPTYRGNRRAAHAQGRYTVLKLNTIRLDNNRFTDAGIATLLQIVQSSVNVQEGIISASAPPYMWLNKAFEQVQHISMQRNAIGLTGVSQLLHIFGIQEPTREYKHAAPQNTGTGPTTVSSSSSTSTTTTTSSTSTITAAERRILNRQREQASTNKIADNANLAATKEKSSLTGKFTPLASKLHRLDLRSNPAWSDMAFYTAEAHKEYLRIEAMEMKKKNEVGSSRNGGNSDLHVGMGVGMGLTGNVWWVSMYDAYEGTVSIGSTSAAATSGGRAVGTGRRIQVDVGPRRVPLVPALLHPPGSQSPRGRQLEQEGQGIGKQKGGDSHGTLDPTRISASIQQILRWADEEEVDSGTDTNTSTVPVAEVNAPKSRSRSLNLGDLRPSDETDAHDDDIGNSRAQQQRRRRDKSMLLDLLEQCFGNSAMNIDAANKSVNTNTKSMIMRLASTLTYMGHSTPLSLVDLDYDDMITHLSSSSSSSSAIDINQHQNMHLLLRCACEYNYYYHEAVVAYKKSQSAHHVYDETSAEAIEQSIQQSVEEEYRARSGLPRRSYHKEERLHRNSVRSNSNSISSFDDMGTVKKSSTTGTGTGMASAHARQYSLYRRSSHRQSHSEAAGYGAGAAVSTITSLDFHGRSGLVSSNSNSNNYDNGRTIRICESQYFRKSHANLLAADSRLAAEVLASQKTTVEDSDSNSNSNSNILNGPSRPTGEKGRRRTGRIGVPEARGTEEL